MLEIKFRKYHLLILHLYLILSVEKNSIGFVRDFEFHYSRDLHILRVRGGTKVAIEKVKMKLQLLFLFFSRTRPFLMKY